MVSGQWSTVYNNIPDLSYELNLIEGLSTVGIVEF